MTDGLILEPDGTRYCPMHDIVIYPDEVGCGGDGHEPKAREVRCPVEDHEGDVTGCGHVFTATPDDEGFFDCPNCGMWFDPDHPNSKPQPRQETS